jgi:hypothetical protein
MYLPENYIKLAKFTLEPFWLDIPEESWIQKSAPLFMDIGVIKDQFQLVRPVENFIRDHYNGVLIKSQLNRFDPGGRIPLHIDSIGLDAGKEAVNPRYYYSHRVHLILDINPDIEMIVNDERLDVENGDLIEYNNLVPHTAVNKSNKYRYMFTFLCVPKENLHHFEII